MSELKDVFLATSLEELIRGGDTARISAWLGTNGVLSLDVEGWGLKHIKPLSESLADSKVALLELSLADNPIEDFEDLFCMLDYNSSIQTLWLDSTGIEDESLRRLACHLPNWKLHDLYLRSNMFTDEGMNVLIDALRRCKGIIPQIDISFNPNVSRNSEVEFRNVLQSLAAHE